MDKYDLELKTYYFDRKQEIKKEYVGYVSKHNEIREILNDFTSNLLFNKPEDPYKFAKDYFSFFNDKANAPVLKPLIISGPWHIGRVKLCLCVSVHSCLSL